MKGMLSLLAKPVVIAFVLCIFTYVFVEQAIQTWLPKLYNDVFSLSESAAVFLAGSWPLSIAAGRLAWGVAMRYFDWFKVLVGGLLAGIGIMMTVSVMIQADPTGTLVALPFTEFSIPLAALLLPSIGFFIGAIYPTVCASLLSSLEKTKHSPMTGWIIVFSAFGGTVGSRMMAIFYENSSGVGAIAMLIYPVVFMLAVLLPFAYLRKKAILRNKNYVQFANT
jgi:fucose permease